jgi:16S rRNA processing protein RimM
LPKRLPRLPFRNNIITMAPVGRISKLFGLAGEVIVNLYDTFPEAFDTKEPLLVVIDSLTVPLFLEKFERRGRSGALVRFADMDTPERVSELLGLEFSISGGRREPEEEDDGGEVYLDDLVGFGALFAGNDLKGEISGFIDHEHNPLFSLSVDGREVLIPATDEFICSFDPDRRTVTFDLPEGLLELYL